MQEFREARRLFVVGICLFLLSNPMLAMHGESGDGKPVVHANAASYQRAAHALDTLQGWYNPTTGLYQTTGWWNSANAITALTDFSRIRKTKKYNPILANTFTAAQKTSKRFLNDYYDDEGWWALAWIDAYDLTGRKEYRAMAETIFADMAASWDDTCGGGIWWSRDRKYKNAIANELFLSVAAHLANRHTSKRAFYLQWANKEWSWFAQSGMINSQSLINDGLTITTGNNGTSTCKNNGQNVWSYNQGVVLGGLVELSKGSQNPALLRTASEIATAAIQALADQKGVLHDPCEPKCGADGTQFKGIFVRNLTVLQKAAPSNDYVSVVKVNADSIWDSAQGPNYQFGQVWTGAFDQGEAGSQSSALDALVAAAVLQGR